MGSSLVNFPKIAFRNESLFPSKVHLYKKILYDQKPAFTELFSI